LIFNVKNGKDSSEITIIAINGHRIKCIPETGSENTIISTELYRKLFQRYLLHTTKKKFSAYAQKEPLNCRGFFRARITHNRCIVSDKVYVIDGDAETLLGRTACCNLGIFVKTGHIRNVTPKDPEQAALDELLRNYDDVFHGVLVTDYQHKVTVDPSVSPVARKLCSKPYICNG
jgi:hypothetical protein